MKLPPVILVDGDGVLTDGRLTIDSKGEKLFKSFHTRDIRAIRELISRGFEVVIVTADDSGFFRCFADKVGAEWITTRDKSKLLKAYPEFIMVGDDAWDIPLLKAAYFAFCPADADMAVRKLPPVRVLETKGGEGVMAELLHNLLFITGG